jgi:hypothetical protein
MYLFLLSWILFLQIVQGIHGLKSISIKNEQVYKLLKRDTS